MPPLDICILGGTGFVGRHLVRRLDALGHAVLVVTRRRERHRDLLVLPNVQVAEGDVHNPAVLRAAFRGRHAVINLVGILNASARGFERVHVELPAKIVAACQAAGVTCLLHMSALNAGNGDSLYLRSKGRGEEVAQRGAGRDLHVTSFRPSVIFGPDDSFLNRFAALLRSTPAVLPLACPHARFQPVYVEDVAQVFVTALADQRSHDHRYNLCGPRAYTLHELVAHIATWIGVRRRIIDLPDWVARVQAHVLGHLPGKLFTLDNYRSLQVDAVCEAEFPALFGLAPKSIEEIMPAHFAQSAINRR